MKLEEKYLNESNIMQEYDKIVKSLYRSAEKYLKEAKNQYKKRNAHTALNTLNLSMHYMEKFKEVINIELGK